MSAINDVVVAVIGLMNATRPFANVTRGALPTGAGLVCEVGPSMPQENYLDRTTLVPLDLTLNGKHANLQTLSDAMNTIHGTLTRATSYPSGTGWQIVEINNAMLPSIIGREPDNQWLMASSLTVMVHWTNN